MLRFRGFCSAEKYGYTEETMMIQRFARWYRHKHDRDAKFGAHLRT